MTIPEIIALELVVFHTCQVYHGFLKVFPRSPTFFHSKGVSFFLVRAVWCLKLNAFLMRRPGNRLSVRSALLSGLLALKQIRLGGPQGAGTLAYWCCRLFRACHFLSGNSLSSGEYPRPLRMLAVGFRVHQIPKTEDWSGINKATWDVSTVLFWSRWAQFQRNLD